MRALAADVAIGQDRHHSLYGIRHLDWSRLRFVVLDQQGFALDESRPLCVFAGLWTAWSGVRKAKTGWEENVELYGFLTTEPNAVVAPIHPKAMPVILTTSEEIDVWLNAGWNEAKALQRSLNDDQSVIIARGQKQDASL